MARAFIGIGSNIDAEENVRTALRRLRARVHVLRMSTFYRTAPWGRPGQPSFINGVIEVETELPPLELKFRVLRQLEEELGRRRGADKYAPRSIDLDLLVYDTLELVTELLVLPDPEIPRRPFLIIPLGELEPELVLPGSDRCLREIAGGCTKAAMQPLPAYTELIRKDIADESCKS